MAAAICVSRAARIAGYRSPYAFIFRCSMTRESPSAFAARDTFPGCWRNASAM
jgi:hypothetical protein